MLPIHERVTLVLCHRSPAPAVIYRLQDIGQQDDAARFFCTGQHVMPALAFVLSTRSTTPGMKTHTCTAKYRRLVLVLLTSLMIWNVVPLLWILHSSLQETSRSHWAPASASVNCFVFIDWSIQLLYTNRQMLVYCWFIDLISILYIDILMSTIDDIQHIPNNVVFSRTSIT